MGGVQKVDKKGNEIMYNLEGPINQSVFPGLQGGPHNHTISALATALKQAASPEFKAYQEKVLSNSQAFAKAMTSRGYSRPFLKYTTRVVVTPRVTRYVRPRKP